jgi:cold shock CspA family protein
MEGTIWHIYPRREKGMIRSDDGYELPFSKSRLNDVEFLSLFSGLRVSYQVQDSWLGKEAVAVRPLPGNQGGTDTKSAEERMPGFQLWVKLQAGRKCITVPGGHVLVGVTGLFAREVRLPVGMPVVVQICRGQDEVSLHGTVSSSFADLGVSVEFEEKSELALEKLAALLAA